MVSYNKYMSNLLRNNGARRHARAQLSEYIDDFMQDGCLHS